MAQSEDGRNGHSECAKKLAAEARLGDIDIETENRPANGGAVFCFTFSSQLPTGCRFMLSVSW